MYKEDYSSNSKKSVNNTKKMNAIKLNDYFVPTIRFKLYSGSTSYMFIILTGIGALRKPLWVWTNLGICWVGAIVVQVAEFGVGKKLYCTLAAFLVPF